MTDLEQKQQQHVWDELNNVFCEVFSDDSIHISGKMTSNDIDGWDSMSHLNLILAIENKFNINFTQRELMKQRDVSDLFEDIKSKI